MGAIYRVELRGKEVYVAPNKRDVVRLRLEGKTAILQSHLHEHMEGVKLILDALGGEVISSDVKDQTEAEEIEETGKRKLEQQIELL